MKKLWVLFFSLLSLPASAQQKLTVYVPGYFASEWGPGPKIEELFEAQCNCDLVYESGDLLPRMMIEGASIGADVIMGLNSDAMKKARGSGALAPHGIDLGPLKLPIDYADDVFVPFDYGHAAFIYDNQKITKGPRSFDDLANLPDDLRIAINDPRSSSSGLAMVLWVYAAYGDQSEAIWRQLAPKIETVTSDWSTSYGLFTEGQVDIVLSYTTSPAYHIVAEGDTTKSAAIFDEGHYLYLELAALTARGAGSELGQAFLAFTLSPAFQNMIGLANWSLPTALEKAEWPTGIAELPMPKTVLYFNEDEAEAHKEKAIEAWRRGLSQ